MMCSGLQVGFKLDSATSEVKARSGGVRPGEG